VPFCTSIVCWQRAMSGTDVRGGQTVAVALASASAGGCQALHGPRHALGNDAAPVWSAQEASSAGCRRTAARLLQQRPRGGSASSHATCQRRRAPGRAVDAPRGPRRARLQRLVACLPDAVYPVVCCMPSRHRARTRPSAHVRAPVPPAACPRAGDYLWCALRSSTLQVALVPVTSSSSHTSTLPYQRSAELSAT
jgi:hypothetical protein